MKNLLAALAAAAIVFAAMLADAAPAPAPAPIPTPTAQRCPKGSALAQRVTFSPDGTITVHTRCVKVVK